MAGHQPTLGIIAILSMLVLAAASDDHDAKVTVVTFGSTIKLVHVASGHRLHSHDVSYGTGSRQQSVTGFHSSGDANSYWLVKGAHGSRQRSGGEVVRCGDTIRLQHLRTGKNLHSHDHRAPMNRDYEVSAYALSNGKFVDGDMGDDWKVECGWGKKEWGRADEIRLSHMVTGAYLSSSTSLVFGEPIPQQLQISGSNRKNANTVWKADEGIFLAPVKEN